MPRYEELRGQVAIVTGAGRGIGRAIAMRLAREGVLVAVTDVDLEGAQTTVRQVQDGDGQAIAMRVDVTSSQDVQQMVAATVERFGKLNILVNNAGIAVIAPLLDTDEATWDRLMAVNAKGVLLCAQAAARQMIQQGQGGRIITNASGAGKIAPGKAMPLGAYAASKHAVVALTKQFGLELADHQILVTCVCGGIIDTPMWDLIDRDVARLEGVAAGTVTARSVATIPLGRMQQPEDLANVVAFLASNDASYMTADAVNVAGGLLPY